MSDTEISVLVDRLLELQRLDRVPRTGYLLRGVVEPESVAEHSFHVAVLVWTLGRDVPRLDLARALALALFHDCPEVRTGDLPKTASGYLPDGAKAHAEGLIARDLLAPLAAEGPALVGEYQAAATLESRFVHACDRLQLLLKVAHYEAWATGRLDEFWRHPERFQDGGFEAVRTVYEELLARRRR